MPTRPMTYGEKAVGFTFNPSAGSETGDHVQSIKVAVAAYIDICNNLRLTEFAKPKEEQNSEKIRMYSVAITEAQTSQMWAVKAVTWAN